MSSLAVAEDETLLKEVSLRPVEGGEDQDSLSNVEELYPEPVEENPSEEPREEKGITSASRARPETGDDLLSAMSFERAQTGEGDGDSRHQISPAQTNSEENLSPLESQPGSSDGLLSAPHSQATSGTISSYLEVLAGPSLPPAEELVGLLMSAAEEKNKFFWGIVYSLLYFFLTFFSISFLAGRTRESLGRETSQIYKWWLWIGALLLYSFLLYKYASPGRGSRIKELMSRLEDSQLVSVARNLKGFMEGKALTPLLIELQHRGLSL